MKAIILAAGRGSRMKALSDERPKCMVEVRGRPLLDWQLESLWDAGIGEIAIVTGYKRELLANSKLIEFHNPRWSQTNMLSSLACAQQWLESEPCIVTYSDIFYDTSAVKALMLCSGSLVVSYDPNWLSLWSKRFSDPLVDAETFQINPDGSLSEIGNKPRTIEEVQGQYIGLLRFSPAGWSEVKRILASLPRQECDRMHMTNMLQKVIEAGNIKIYLSAYEEEWGEVDSAEDLMYYNRKIQ